MKLCSSCKIKKEFEAFAKNRSKKDGYNTSCKLCKNEQQKRWYHKHQKEQYVRVKARNTSYRKILQDNLCGYLSERECTDCGNKDIRVLEFDHLSDKKFNISEMMARTYSWDSIISEIEKCEVVCRNCHQIRTHERGNFYKHVFWKAGVTGKRS